MNYTNYQARNIRTLALYALLASFGFIVAFSIQAKAQIEGSSSPLSLSSINTNTIIADDFPNDISYVRYSYDNSKKSEVTVAKSISLIKSKLVVISIYVLLVFVLILFKSLFTIHFTNCCKIVLLYFRSAFSKVRFNIHPFKVLNEQLS